MHNRDAKDASISDSVSSSSSTRTNKYQIAHGLFHLFCVLLLNVPMKTRWRGIVAGIVTACLSLYFVPSAFIFTCMSIFVFLLVGVFIGFIVCFCMISSDEQPQCNFTSKSLSKETFERHRNKFEEWIQSDFSAMILPGSNPGINTGTNIDSDDDLDRLPVQIREVIQRIVSHFIRDFIDIWYDELIPTSQDRSFQVQVEKLIIHAILALYTCTKGRQGEIAPLLVYGFLQVLIINIKAFRKFEAVLTTAASFTPSQPEGTHHLHNHDLNSYLRDYISSHKDKDPFWKSMSYSSVQELSHLYHYSANWLRHLLSNSEIAAFPKSCQSILLAELLANQFLYPIIQKICDPYYLNKTIIWIIQQRYLMTFTSVLSSSSQKKLNMIELKMKIRQIQNIPYLDTSEFYLNVQIEGMKQKKKTRMMNVHARNNKTEPLTFKLFYMPSIALHVEFFMSVTDSATDICLSKSDIILPIKEILLNRHFRLSIPLNPVSGKYFRRVPASKPSPNSDIIVVMTEWSVRDLDNSISMKRTRPVVQRRELTPPSHPIKPKPGKLLRSGSLSSLPLVHQGASDNAEANDIDVPAHPSAPGSSDTWTIMLNDVLDLDN